MGAFAGEGANDHQGEQLNLELPDASESAGTSPGIRHTSSSSVTAQTTAAECAGIDCVIIHFYEVILGRTPSQGEIDAWHYGYFDWLVAQDLDVRFIPSEMGRQFFLSAEYEARATDDTTFITQNYNAFLYRDPSQGELDGWTPVANRREAMSIFSRSEEFLNRVAEMFPGLAGNAARNFVTTMYLGLLDRLPDSEGLAYAAYRFDRSSLKRALAKQMGRDVSRSQEYLEKRNTDYLRVESLYRAYMGRFPNNNEIAYWTGVLAEGEIDMDEIIEILGDSLEFSNTLLYYFPGEIH